ncbi:MAG: hypothetical protein PHV34_13350 [Verrucomicrobiae bacterium]|nr:hypothetical protein [Verrucomicrobiae bacterium]
MFADKTKLRSLWIPAFAGMTEEEYAHFTIVIPANAGIQLALRRASSTCLASLCRRSFGEGASSQSEGGSSVKLPSRRGGSAT